MSPGRPAVRMWTELVSSGSVKLPPREEDHVDKRAFYVGIADYPIPGNDLMGRVDAKPRRVFS